MGCNTFISSLQLPMGVRFKPTDEELCVLLERKVRGLELPCNEVVEMDVYSRESWLLGDQGKDSFCSERYYFVKRETKSASGNGVTPKREIGGECCGGWRKAGVGEAAIKVEDRTIGYRKQLKFMSYKDGKRQRKEFISTPWIMHENTLPSKHKFQEWVLCRIKNNSKKPDQEAKPEMEKVQVVLDKLENQALLNAKGSGHEDEQPNV